MSYGLVPIGHIAGDPRALAHVVRVQEREGDQRRRASRALTRSPGPTAGGFGSPAQLRFEQRLNALVPHVLRVAPDGRYNELVPNLLAEALKDPLLREATDDDLALVMYESAKSGFLIPQHLQPVTERDPRTGQVRCVAVPTIAQIRLRLSRLVKARQIQHYHTATVRDGDLFVFHWNEGSDYFRFDPVGARGTITHHFAFVRISDTQWIAKVHDLRETAEARAASRIGHSRAWELYPAEMGQVMVLKAIAPQVPGFDAGELLRGFHAPDPEPMAPIMALGDDPYDAPVAAAFRIVDDQADEPHPDDVCLPGDASVFWRCGGKRLVECSSRILLKTLAWLQADASRSARFPRLEAAILHHLKRRGVRPQAAPSGSAE